MMRVAPLANLPVSEQIATRSIEGPIIATAIAVWLVIGTASIASYALSPGFGELGIGKIIVMNMTFFVPWMVLTVGVIACSHRLPALTIRFWALRGALLVVMLALLASASITFAKWLVFPLIGMGGSLTTLIQRSMLVLPFVSIFIAIAVLAAAYGRSHFLEADHSRRALAEARLQVLIKQLNPHMLFNALQCVSQLAEERSEKAGLIVDDLAAILRSVTDCGGSDWYPIDKEIALGRRLIALYAAMREQPIDFEVQWRTPRSNFLIPALIFQPLIENALRHGFDGVLDACVRLTIESDEKKVHVTIEDNGRGCSPSVTEGVGLAMTRRRLNLLGGTAGRLAIVPAVGPWKTRVEITYTHPYRTE